MPAPGDQHVSHGGQAIINPFEEVKPRISEYTAQEIASLQSRLEKQLGPEYISSRAGPAGQKVHYVTAEKCIQLANEVFGFNGWSSQIMKLEVDFVDENPNTGKVSLGLSVIVRVTLRDGTFHEDIGYGHIDNCKGKAPAFEKAKKEGTTDALKRALRNFGNVLGNCIYDKDYLAKVTKVKVAPTKWNVDDLHRHSTYASALVTKREIEISPGERSVQEASKQLDATEPVSPDTLDDDFGDFDDSDFAVSHDADCHPDEVSLPITTASHHFGPSHFGQTLNASNVANSSSSNTSRAQNMPAPGRPLPNNAQSENRQTRNGNPTAQQLPNQPQTPRSIMTRSGSGAAGASNGLHPPQNLSSNQPPVQGAVLTTGRVLNQPSRMALNSAPTSPVKQAQPQPQPHPYKPLGSNDDISGSTNLAPGTGFFSARAAQAIVDHDANGNADIPPPQARNLPTFNPHAESPSIRKTPGVDHTKTRPTTRDLKHVEGSVSAEDGATLPAGTIGAGAGGAAGSMNVINPQLNAARRIGAPGSPSPLGGGVAMGMGNRSAYKPLSVKRGVDGGAAARPPLGNLPLPANGVQPISQNDNTDGGGDLKRQRIGG